MSLRIIRNGLLDTIQDAGRYGYQHLGINPGGAMDRIAMRIANALVGNNIEEAVIEMHFPAAEIVFEKAILMALGGADFSATVNEKEISLLQPVLVGAGAVLRFAKKKTGARVYLAVQGGFVADEWLHSYSTHLNVKAGGFEGRALHKNDTLLFKNEPDYSVVFTQHQFETLPWKAKVSDLYCNNSFRFIPGEEYDLLDAISKQKIMHQSFTISRESNRMGNRVQADALQLQSPKEMISTAVTLGTIQLLPDGQLIILMADHQTTGGYPRLGHIISADIPSLAQLFAGEKFFLQPADIQTAEALLAEQEMNLQQLQNACNFRLQEYFSS
jgi:antagonist of KipI